MTACKDVERLRPPFIHAAKWLLHTIDKKGLPFLVYETWRSAETQEKYYERKVTKARAGQSPHNHGLAVDFVLDTKKIRVRRREWKGRLYPDAWDDETPEAVDAWCELGAAAQGLGLVWGGKWIKKNATPKRKTSGDLVVLGWDLPHVELSGWNSYR